MASFCGQRSDHSLHGELHDGVDQVVVSLLEGSYGFVARDVRLRHDQLDVLLFHAGGVELKYGLINRKKRISRLRHRSLPLEEQPNEMVGS